MRIPLFLSLAALAAAPLRAQPACPTTCDAFIDPPGGSYSAFTDVTAAAFDGAEGPSCPASSQGGGRVAACVGGTLRDVVAATEVAGQTRYFLTVGGGVADREADLSFRYCAAGATTPVDLSPSGNGDNSPTFFPDRTYGSPSIPYRLGSPVTLAPTVTASQPTTAPGAGWRQLAAPLACATLDDAVGFTWTQGFPGADASGGSPTVYRYDEAATGDLDAGFRLPDAQSEPMARGVGYFVYLFEDDVAGGAVDGGFPKTLTATGPVIPETEDFAFAVSFTDGGTADPAANDGWNLLGNPFPEPLDWDAVQRTGVAETVYAYDPALPGYRMWNGVMGDLTDGVIGPWQGFWVQATAPGPALVAPAAARGGALRRATRTVEGALELRVAGTVDGVAREASAFVSFEDGAQAGTDPSDGHALPPLDGPWLLLATEAEGGARLKLDARSAAIEGETRIPLVISASSDAPAQLELRWPHLDAPAGSPVWLVDDLVGTRVDLAEQAAYPFEHATGQDGRFALAIGAGPVAAEAGTPGSHRLAAVSPNPARVGASLTLMVGHGQRVRAALYDVLGRRLRTLHDGPAEPGRRLRLSIDAERLPPGTYVVRVVGERFADARRFTVAR